MAEILKGWKFVGNSLKAHYFNNDNISLCGKWLAWSIADVEDKNHKSKDNCAACMKKRESIKET